MAAREKPSFEQRVAEYVDSPLMTQRLRFGNEISALIAGNFGAYRTSTKQSKKVEGECTCPSELWPCKHVYALHATWAAHPGSFFDLDQWLENLKKEPKASLVEAIGNMVSAFPQLLTVFGVPGFDIDDEYDEERYD